MRKNAAIEVPAKPWWKSRTLWLNIIGVAILIVGTVVDSQDLLKLPEQWRAWLTVTLAILNAVNRFFTVQPIDNSAALSVKTLCVTDSDGTAKAVS